PREHLVKRRVTDRTAGMTLIHGALLVAGRVTGKPGAVGVHCAVEHQPPTEVLLGCCDGGCFEVGEACHLEVLPDDVARSWISPRESDRLVTRDVRVEPGKGPV